MSYWASLEIEMSLLGKRLSAGQFIKESVGVVKLVLKLLTRRVHVLVLLAQGASSILVVGPDLYKSYRPRLTN